MLYKSVGATIRKRRTQLGLTQVDLCRQIQISRSVLANVETGRQRVLLHQLYQIAHGLDINVAALLPGAREAENLEALDGLSVSENVSLKEREQIARLLQDNEPSTGSRGQHGPVVHHGRTDKRPSS